MFFTSITEINSLIIEGMSNIYLLKIYYWEKLTFSKLRFSKFEKFASSSVSGEFQLTQIPLNFQTSSYNLKIRSIRAEVCGFSVILILKGIMAS